jgi:hypothetical protein
MQALYNQIDALIDRTKNARVRALTLANPCTVAGDQLATDLAELSKDFLCVSTALRQAAREQADAEVTALPKWQRPRMNANRTARAMEKKGAIRL